MNNGASKEENFGRGGRFGQRAGGICGSRSRFNLHRVILVIRGLSRPSRRNDLEIPNGMSSNDFGKRLNCYEKSEKCKKPKYFSQKRNHKVSICCENMDLYKVSQLFANLGISRSGLYAWLQSVDGSVCFRFE